MSIRRWFDVVDNGREAPVNRLLPRSNDTDAMPYAYRIAFRDLSATFPDQTYIAYAKPLDTRGQANIIYPMRNFEYFFVTHLMEIMFEIIDEDETSIEYRMGVNVFPPTIWSTRELTWGILKEGGGPDPFPIYEARLTTEFTLGGLFPVADALIDPVTFDFTCRHPAPFL